MQDRGPHLRERSAFECPRVGEHLVQHGAERKDVRPVIGRFVEHLLGRHVAEGAEVCQRLPHWRGRIVRRRRRLPFAQLGDAKVEQFDAAVGGDERVGRFDVAMPDVLRVHRIQRLRDLDAVIDRLAERDRAAVDPGAQRLAFEQLGDDVRNARVGAYVEDGDDVRVVETAGGPRFAAESRDVFLAGRGPLQDLHRDFAMQLRIAGAVDLSHASGAQEADDLLAAETVAGREGQWLCGHR